ncbi:MAG: c-type cytochrome [Lentisphaeraceae bacterium]|nr:c-type cytochrome [Lentisphaeraceae bacterium]
MKNVWLFISMLVLCQGYAAEKLSPEEEKGKSLYTLNCMACHALDKMVVGPSLVEIAHIYKGKAEGIVTWSMAPGKKRKLAIRMPPMSHVGEERLKQISSYIFKATKGMKYVKEKSKGDPYATFPKAKIQRMFMPDAGPAAIAVSLNENVHLCWDAGTCQFRYAWNGGYIDPWPVLRGNGNGLVKLKGEKFVYAKQGNPFSKGPVKFNGYRVKQGLPVFMFKADGVNFEVELSTQNSNEVTATFTTDSNKALTYTPQLSQGSWSASTGKVTDGSLSLTADQAKKFSITFKAGDK